MRVSNLFMSIRKWQTKMQNEVPVPELGSKKLSFLGKCHWGVQWRAQKDLCSRSNHVVMLCKPTEWLIIISFAKGEQAIHVLYEQVYILKPDIENVIQSMIV